MEPSSLLKKKRVYVNQKVVGKLKRGKMNYDGKNSDNSAMVANVVKMLAH